MRGVLKLLKSGKQKKNRRSSNGTGASVRRYAFETLENRLLLSASTLETPLSDFGTGDSAPALLADKSTPTVSISSTSADTPKAGETYSLDVIFNADPSASVQTSLSILSLRIYFDSTFFVQGAPTYYNTAPTGGVKVDLSSSITGNVPILVLSDLYTADLDNNFTPTIYYDTLNADGDANTNYYLQIVWSTGTNAYWKLNQFPQTLCKLQFTIEQGSENRTTYVRFGENDLSAAWSFASTPATIAVSGREPFNTPDTPVAATTSKGWSEICVSWDKTENAGGYSIRYFTDPRSTTPLETFDIDADYINTNIDIDPSDPAYPDEDMSFTVTGLDDGTLYYFQIMIRGGGGNADSGWSNAVSISTLSDTPTDIDFTPGETVYSGDPAGTYIGTLSTEDIDPNATFAYVIRTYGELFVLGGENGDQILLKNSAVPFGEYTVSIQSTNSRNHSCIRNVVITIVSGKPTASAGEKLIETSSATEAGTALAIFTTETPSERLAQDDFSYTVYSGDANKNFTFVGRYLCVAENPTTPLEAGKYTLTIRAATPSKEYCDTTYELTVYNPPDAEVSAGALTVVAGCSFLLSAEDSTPSPDFDAGTIVSYEWDLDGDGEADLTTAEQSVYIDASLCRSEQDADGNRQITLRVRDSAGLVSAAEKIDVTITPADPVIFARAVEYASGQVLKLNLQTYAFSTAPVVSWTIDWGEGEPETFAAGETLKTAHCYASTAVKREYPILITLTDAANVNRTVCIGSHTVPASATAAEIFSALESPLAEEDAVPTFPTVSAPITEADDALLIYLKSRDLDETLQTLLAVRSGLTSGAVSNGSDTESPLPDETPAQTAAAKPTSLLLKTTESTGETEETNEFDGIVPAI